MVGALLGSEKKRCQLLELHQLLGRKWTVPLLGEMEQGPHSFNQLKRKTANQINTTLLSRTLQDLIKHNVITTRKKEKGSKEEGRSFHYELTTAGQELVPLLCSWKEWAKRNKFALPENCSVSGCLNCGHFLQPRYRER